MAVTFLCFLVVFGKEFMLRSILIAATYTALSIISQLPIVVLIVIAVFVFFLAALVLLNESACGRLIRILKAMGGSDNTPRRKRR
jgi:hypothetical protein